MDLRLLAKGVPYKLTTSLDECPINRFWVVLLESGLEVYQSPDDPLLDEPNPWMRLKKFIADNQLRIVNMAFGCKNGSRQQINLDPMANGYFYSKRMRKLMTSNPAFSGYGDEAEGVGHLHDNKLTIFWELPDGQVETEIKTIGTNPKCSNPFSLIRS